MQEHTLDIETIVAQRHWLRDLARQIARTEADAEDLEQGVMAAALSHPLGAVREPRAWLSRVARNLATKTGRADRARVAREERCRADRQVPATDQAVANTEVFALLSRLVLALDEPYRSTLILRFYQDLTPAQIAREMNVPASTVRTRLARSLALLRAKLDERDPGARWIGALAPVTLPSVAFAADGTRRAAIAGGILALCGVTTMAVVGLRGQGAGTTPPTAPLTDFVPVDDSSDDTSGKSAMLEHVASPRSEVEAPGADRSAELAGASLETAPADPVSHAADGLPPVTPPPGTLEILVTVNGVPHPEGIVLLDLAVEKRASGWPDPELRVGGATPARQRSLNSHGRAQFDGLSEGQWRIATCVTDGHSAQRTCTLKAGEGRTFEVALTSGAVTGHAYDTTGRPIVDAFVSLSPTVGSSNGQLTKTDTEGVYRMDFAWHGTSWISLHPDAVYPNHRNSVGPMESIAIPKTGDIVHDFGTAKGLAMVRIKLLTRGGEVPVSDRGFRLHVDGVDSGRYHGDYFSEKNGCEVTLPLEAGSWKVQTADKSDFLSQRLLLKEIDVALEDMTVDAVLPGTRVVVDVEGVLDPHSTYVRVCKEPGSPGWTGGRIEGSRWVIDGVAAGDWWLYVGTPGEAQAEPIKLHVGESDIELRETAKLLH